MFPKDITKYIKKYLIKFMVNLIRMHDNTSVKKSSIYKVYIYIS